MTEKFREVCVIAAAFESGGNRVDGGNGLTDARAFVIAKEEELVLFYGAAEGEAELILTVLAFGNAAGVFEEIGGVEFVVAKELPGAAVELVRAGFDGGIENGSGGAADFGAVVAGLYFEFLNGIYWRADGVGGAVQEIDEIGVVVYAIE